MPKGNFDVDVPHFCGELIHVNVSWYEFYGSRINPPEYEEHHEYFAEQMDYDISHCPKCGINLYDDTLFQRNIEVAADKLVDRGEQTPYDESDFEPDDGPLDIEMSFDDALWHSLSHLDKENPSRGRP